VASSGTIGQERAAHLTNLVITLLASFEETGDGHELSAALAAIDEAVTVPAPVDRVRSAVQSTSCAILRVRFRYTGNSADLDRAVRAGASAVALLPSCHPDLRLALTNVGLARHVRARRRGSADELNQAVGDLHAAVDATPADDPDRAGHLSNLCDVLLSRADLGGVTVQADLDAAVAYGRSAQLVGKAYWRRGYYPSNLGNALLDRYSAMGGHRGLDEAIAVQQCAVETCAPDVSHPAACLANLAVAEYTRYEQSSPEAADPDPARGPSRVRAGGSTNPGHCALGALGGDRWTVGRSARRLHCGGGATGRCVTRRVAA
jgi:hypothetical protein